MLPPRGLSQAKTPLGSQSPGWDGGGGEAVPDHQVQEGSEGLVTEGWTPGFHPSLPSGFIVRKALCLPHLPQGVHTVSMHASGWVLQVAGALSPSPARAQPGIRGGSAPGRMGASSGQR